jgi:uncharacterized phiE125 gp8 family phage protein
MKTKIKTPRAKYAVTLAEAKVHLRLHTNDTTLDDQITSLIPVATKTAEEMTGRRFIQTDWYAYLRCWPSKNRIKLPFGQLKSVASVKYRDTDESESTFSSDNYRTNTNVEPGEIVLKYSKTWPSATLSPDWPITVEFTCGYGENETDVPDDIKRGVCILIDEFLQNPQNIVITQGGVVHNLKVAETALFSSKVFL